MRKLNKNPSPNLDRLNNLMDKIDFAIDSDYWDFIKNHDGGEGFLNATNFIQLWGVDDLIALNPYYPNDLACEELFFFGTNGSNLGYAFHKRTGKIMSIDFIDIGVEEPQTIASSFTEFINSLSA